MVIDLNASPTLCPQGGDNTIMEGNKKNTVVRKIMLYDFKFASISTNNLLSGAMKSSWYSLNRMVSGSFGKSSLYENAIGSSTCLSVSHPYSTSFA